MNHLPPLICAISVLLCSCQSTNPTKVSTNAFPDTVRISDEYNRAKVASYEVFEWPVSQHCMAIVKLKSGTVIPLLCRQKEDSIYPIAQSVFATNDPTLFSIMCEPLIVLRDVHTHALMRITVVLNADGLFNGRHRAQKISPTPPLLERL